MPSQRSANAFAFGARNGVRMISTPSLRKTLSKARLNLLSRSWWRSLKAQALDGATQLVGGDAPVALGGVEARGGGVGHRLPGHDPVEARA